MFPHTITIFHHEIKGDNDIYTRYVVRNVYWYGEKGVAESGKGTEATKSITVITSADTAKTYGKSWSVQARDRIVKGVCPEISSFKELDDKEVITVTGVAENIIGSDVDNVTITGK